MDSEKTDGTTSTIVRCTDALVHDTYTIVIASITTECNLTSPSEIRSIEISDDTMKESR